MKTAARKRVAFICTYNSVRSQMAEGILRHLYGESYDVVSAGIAPAGLHPYAVQVLREKGVDLSSQKSRSVMQLRGDHFDYLVTLSDELKMTSGLPIHGTRTIHRPFTSPPEVEYDEEKVLEGFRALRDEMWRFIEVTFRPPSHRHSSE